MRILVIGSGGREHALVYSLAKSPLVDAIYIAPGNGGTCQYGQNVNIGADDIDGLVSFAKSEKIDLVTPGPELPLTLGVTDAMRVAGIACFGPDSYCARLEGSKSFAKEIMASAGVPTAACRVFSNAEEAANYVRNGPEQLVIKADGLAAGKGVIVASSRQEALAAVRDMLEDGHFGKAGQTILAEERLEGEEVSLLCLCDGKTVRPLPSAQDHKAIYDNDRGPNTGGMGAYSPAPLLPDAELEKMADIVARPVAKELARRGHPFVGVLYAGLMLTPSGPKVLEYNVRFGDPECQPLLMRLESDLAEHMTACVNGRLDCEKIKFSPEYALGVVLAAKGYPGAYPKGMLIEGLDAAQTDAQVFHSGTVMDGENVKSCGGRVLCVTATGCDLAAAREKAYAALDKIHMADSYFRKDIGVKGLMRMNLLNH